MEDYDDYYDFELVKTVNQPMFVDQVMEYDPRDPFNRIVEDERTRPFFFGERASAILESLKYKAVPCEEGAVIIQGKELKKVTKGEISLHERGYQPTYEQISRFVNEELPNLLRGGGKNKKEGKGSRPAGFAFVRPQEERDIIDYPPMIQCSSSNWSLKYVSPMDKVVTNKIHLVKSICINNLRSPDPVIEGAGYKFYHEIEQMYTESEVKRSVSSCSVVFENNNDRRSYLIPSVTSYETKTIQELYEVYHYVARRSKRTGRHRMVDLGCSVNLHEVWHREYIREPKFFMIGDHDPIDKLYLNLVILGEEPLGVVRFNWVVYSDVEFSQSTATRLNRDLVNFIDPFVVTKNGDEWWYANVANCCLRPEVEYDYQVNRLRYESFNKKKRAREPKDDDDSYPQILCVDGRGVIMAWKVNLV